MCCCFGRISWFDGGGVCVGWKRGVHAKKKKKNKVEVVKVFAKADIDGNGEIEYTEWLIGTISKRDVLQEEKLLSAFKMFDKDGSGNISRGDKGNIRSRQENKR